MFKTFVVIGILRYIGSEDEINNDGPLLWGMVVFAKLIGNSTSDQHVSKTGT